MKRRQFLLGSGSMLAASAVLTRPAWAWSNDYEVTFDSSGAIVYPEMFGANVLSPWDFLNGINEHWIWAHSGKSVGDHLGRNELDVRLTDVGAAGIVRWPGGSLTEGDKLPCSCGSGTGGDWIPNTGVDFGDFDWTYTVRTNFEPSGAPTPPLRPRPPAGHFRGYWDGSEVKYEWLKTTLDDFLAYLDANATNGIKGVIVLPSIRYLEPWSHTGDRVRYGDIFGWPYSGSMKEFVEYVYDKIANEYPNAEIFAWEIGNEYQGGEGSNMHAMEAWEYAMIAETAIRRIRIINSSAKVAMQAGPLSLNVSAYQTQGDQLYSQYRSRAGNYGTDDPDYLVHHAYSTGEYGHDTHKDILQYLQNKWSGIPVLATEWNVIEPEDTADYGATSDQYRLGMEKAWRLTALFDTMISNNVQGANFWPVVQHSGITMFKYEASGTRYIAADTFALLRNLWLGLWQGNNTSPMRRATVTYSGAGTAVEVFGYCQQNKRRARVFICARGAVAQNVKVTIKGMGATIHSRSMDRLSGVSGPQTFDINSLPTAMVSDNLSVNYQTVSSGHEFTVPIRQTNSAYELIMLDVRYY